MNWKSIKDKELVINDTPFVITDFLNDTQRYVNWEKVNSCLYRRDMEWELINDDGWIQPIPECNSERYGSHQDQGFIANQINKGSGFVIVQYGRFDKETNLLCKEVEENFYCVADIHVYGGLGRSSMLGSFNPHADATANFIIQAEGETLWKIYKNRYSHIASSEPFYPKEEILDVELEVTLTRGDLLFIPARQYHKAFPKDKRLSLSIAMQQRFFNTSIIDRNEYIIGP